MKKRTQQYLQAASLLAVTGVGAALGDQMAQAHEIEADHSLDQEQVSSTGVSTDTATIDIISEEDSHEGHTLEIENPYLAYLNQALVVLPEVPNDFAGKEGYTHVDSRTGFVYEKTADQWVKKAGLKGREGQAKVSIYSSDEAPLEDQGQNGDSHINMTTGQVSRKILGTWTVISQYQVTIEEKQIDLAKDESEPEVLANPIDFNKASQKTSQAFPFIPSYSFVRENNNTIANTGIVNLAKNPTQDDDPMSFVPLAKFSTLLFAGVILR